MSNFNRFAGELRFLQSANTNFCSSLDFEHLDIVPPDDTSLMLVRDIYFILNRSYRAWRMQDEHKTRPTKIASLTALSIMTVRPFRSKIDGQSIFFINPLFAIGCGFAKINKDINSQSDESIKRVSGWLDNFRLPKTEELINTLKVGIESGEMPSYDNFNITLTPRKVFDIDMLVNYFELVSQG